MRVVANSRQKRAGFDETETETGTRRSASPVRPCVDACASRKGGSVYERVLDTSAPSAVFFTLDQRGSTGSYFDDLNSVI